MVWLAVKSVSFYAVVQFQWFTILYCLFFLCSSPDNSSGKTDCSDERFSFQLLLPLSTFMPKLVKSGRCWKKLKWNFVALRYSVMSHANIVLFTWTTLTQPTHSQIFANVYTQIHFLTKLLMLLWQTAAESKVFQNNTSQTHHNICNQVFVETGVVPFTKSYNSTDFKQPQSTE